jgi:hypothetical protein
LPPLRILCPKSKPANLVPPTKGWSHTTFLQFVGH